MGLQVMVLLRAGVADDPQFFISEVSHDDVPGPGTVVLVHCSQRGDPRTTYELQVEAIPQKLDEKGCHRHGEEFIILGPMQDSPQYLRPYLRAAERHGGSFD